MVLRFYTRKIPTDTRRLTNAGSMFAHRLRRWTNIKPALVQRLVFAGICSAIHASLFDFISFCFSSTVRSLDCVVQHGDVLLQASGQYWFNVGPPSTTLD